jgi:hypothetical protein
VPLTVFDCKGIPATRRERIEAAVVTGGRAVTGRFEARLSAAPGARVKVLLTGPFGFQRHVVFGRAEEPAVITDVVRRTIEDDVE